MPEVSQEGHLNNFFTLCPAEEYLKPSENPGLSQKLFE